MKKKKGSHRSCIEMNFFYIIFGLASTSCNHTTPVTLRHKRQNKISKQRLSLGRNMSSTDPENHTNLHTVCMKLGVLNSHCTKNMLKILLSMAFMCQFHDNFVQLRKKCISQSFIDEILSVQIVTQSCFLSRLNVSLKYSSIKQGVHPPQHSTDCTIHMSELLRNIVAF